MRCCSRDQMPMQSTQWRKFLKFRVSWRPRLDTACLGVDVMYFIEWHVVRIIFSLLAVFTSLKQTSTCKTCKATNSKSLYTLRLQMAMTPVLQNLTLSWSSSGKYWHSLQRSASTVGCSLSEVLRRDAEEAETVSAMASLSVNKHIGKRYVVLSICNCSHIINTSKSAAFCHFKLNLLSLRFVGISLSSTWFPASSFCLKHKLSALISNLLIRYVSS